METCPFDIQYTIFTLACTDGGPTGCSLSRVSRYIRDISFPCRWYSVSISGLRQAQQFVDALRSLEPHLRPPIRHLFLSTRCSCNLQESTVQRPALRSWIKWQSTILQHAAPTLQTLAFISFDPPRLGAQYVFDLLTAHLPLLAELTICSRCAPSQILDAPRYIVVPRNVPELSPSKRPQLRCLHLSCGIGFLRYDESQHYTHEGLHKFICACSSSITHLRLALDSWPSSLDEAKMVFAECVEAGFLEPTLLLYRERTPLNNEQLFTLYANPVTWERLLPLSVQLIIIRSPLMWSLNRREIMHIFLAMERDAGGHFAYSVVIQYGYWEAMADWLDRLDGRPGCWVKQEYGEVRLPEDKCRHRYCLEFEQTEDKRFKVKFMHFVRMLKGLVSR